MRIEEENCHEVMVLVTVPLEVTDLALCDSIQREYDEGDMPNGGFILKDKTANGSWLSVRIYIAVVLLDFTIEQERVYLTNGLTAALERLGGDFIIESVGEVKPFSQIEAY